MKNSHQKSREALIWITEILKKLDVPYQIAGGLAAIVYGATRPLEDIDIDIPEDQFEIVQNEVSDFIIYGPERFKSDTWDLMLMTLDYHGQLIDLGGAYHTKIRNKATGEWQDLIANFTAVEMKNIFGLQLPVIAYDELVAYKKALAREVDLIDIAEILKKH